MGCWNETCGLSHLPITGGDDVLVFILAENVHRDRRSSGGFCYPIDLWQPICLPFQGKYNDYGTIGPLTSAPTHWEVTEEVLKDWLLTGPDGPFKVSPLAEDAFDPIERGTITGSRLGYKHGIGHMLVRQDVWQSVLGLKPTHLFYGALSREAAHNDVEEFIRFAQETLPKTLGDLEEQARWNLKINRHFEDRDRTSSSFFWSVFLPSEVSPGFSRYRSILLDRVSQGNVSLETMRSVLGEIADVSYVSRMMLLLRRFWSPQSGKGSQDTQWGLHQVFSEQVAKIAESLHLAELSDLPDDEG